MSKVLSLFLVLFLLCGCDGTASSEQKTTALEHNKIYFFYYNECPYCHQAMDYVNQKYPELKITMVNIYHKGGYDLFTKCAAKFNLGRNIGTPLFCMGDNYLMGWSPASEKTFDTYVKTFLSNH